ncbi:hypothetical protein SeLEV6574_g02537 [Synchytrium endobioticum]|nr:hypothetical protein SeLEV6574_g02537 [Synchytrium endobioticum]
MSSMAGPMSAASHSPCIPDLLSPPASNSLVHSSGRNQRCYVHPLKPLLGLSMDSLVLLLSIMAASMAFGASWTASCVHCHHQCNGGTNAYHSTTSPVESATSHASTRRARTHSSSLAKRLQASVNHLNKRRDILTEQIASLRKAVAHERESRSLIERTCQEKVKRVELDLEFKDTEVLHLRDRIQELEDELDDMSFFHASARRAPLVQASSMHCPAAGHRASRPTHGQEDDGESDDGDDGRGSGSEESAFSVESAPAFCIPAHMQPPGHLHTLSAQIDTFRKTAIERIFQSLVCNVAAVSIVEDVGDLANRMLLSAAGSSSSSAGTGMEMNSADRMRECLGVVSRGVLVFLEKKDFDDTILQQTLARYVRLFNAFTESDADQVYMLHSLERFGNPPPPVRAAHFAKLLMGMYRAEIIDPDAVVEWYDLPSCGETEALRLKCKTFIDWLKQSLREDDDPDSHDEDDDDGTFSQDDDNDFGDEEDAEQPKQTTAVLLPVPSAPSRRTPPQSIEIDIMADHEMHAGIVKQQSPLAGKRSHLVYLLDNHGLSDAFVAWYHVVP